MNKKCLTEAEAAEYIGMSRSYLRQDRMYKGYYANRTPGPSYIKIGRSVRYPLADLEAWVLQHRVERQH